MKQVTVFAAVSLALVFTTTAWAGGGTGNYEWVVSFSDSNPDSSVSPALVGPTPIYLWYRGCNLTSPGGMGMSAAEMDAIFTGGWTQFGFNVQNGFLNAGTATALLLAVGGCPTGPVVAGSWTVLGASGKMALAPATLSGDASTVDCDVNPAQSFWPATMRLSGASTEDLQGTRQDWGNGCTTDAVDPKTWGSLKALYR